MFAMQCSKPMAMKALSGPRMAMNLPPTVCAAVACHTARQTHQLAITALMKVCCRVGVEGGVSGKGRGQRAKDEPVGHYRLDGKRNSRRGGARREARGRGRGGKKDGGSKGQRLNQLGITALMKVYRTGRQERRKGGGIKGRPPKFHNGGALHPTATPPPPRHTAPSRSSHPCRAVPAAASCTCFTG